MGRSRIRKLKVSYFCLVFFSLSCLDWEDSALDRLEKELKEAGARYSRLQERRGNHSKLMEYGDQSIVWNSMVIIEIRNEGRCERNSISSRSNLWIKKGIKMDSRGERSRMWYGYGEEWGEWRMEWWIVDLVDVIVSIGLFSNHWSRDERWRKSKKCSIWIGQYCVHFEKFTTWRGILSISIELSHSMIIGHKSFIDSPMG